MDPYSYYKRTQVESASREDIMLQLVNGALVRVRGARDKWSEGERIRARELRVQAHEIISYLDETLDFENSREIAEELDALYAYMLREIAESSRQDDCEILQPVQEVLETLYQGWRDAVEEYKQEKASVTSSRQTSVAGQVSVG